MFIRLHGLRCVHPRSRAIFTSCPDTLDVKLAGDAKIIAFARWRSWRGSSLVNVVALERAVDDESLLDTTSKMTP